jgi:aubergine-like protein
LRNDTLYDILRKFSSEQRGQDFKGLFEREVLGSIVITRYNNNNYRIDDINWDLTPASTFKDRKGNDKSFVDYYFEKYQIKIRDVNQPLLVSNPRPRDIRGSKTGSASPICLVPELCFATGLNDTLKSNFNLMRAMADYTRMDPQRRIERLIDFNKRIQNTPASVKQFDNFQTQLQPDLITLQARELDQENIIFGNDRKFASDSKNVDWTNPMKTNEMYFNVDMTRWGIIYPRRAAGDTEVFVKLLSEVARGMRYNMAQPKFIEMPDDRLGTYSSHLNDFISKDPKFIMIVVPNNAADRYGAIKKITCVSNAIPTQVIVHKTMQPKKGNMGGVKSIATKVLIQCNVKLGGCPWMVKIPLKGLMTIGFDVNHDSTDKRKSYGAFIATMDLQKSVKYFCSIAPHNKGDELASSIGLLMRKAVIQYHDVHGVLPEKFIFYR